MPNYSITSTNLIVRDGATYFISGTSNVEGNAYQAWLANGNTPAPYVVPPVGIPQTVTPFQAKAALLGAGLLPAVQAAIAAAPQIVQLAWSDATEFTRDSPTIAAMAASLKPPLTSAQLDALFVAASTIQA